MTEFLEVLKYLIPVLLTGVFGYIMGVFNKNKERAFELAKIKASIYNDMFEHLRPALFSDYIEDKSKEEHTERFKLWQTVLKKSDKLWLYSDKKVLRLWKEMFEAYEGKNKDKFNMKVNLFVEECRKDVLKSLGEKSDNESYKFLTYSLPLEILNDNTNRLK